MAVLKVSDDALLVCCSALALIFVCASFLPIGEGDTNTKVELTDNLSSGALDNGRLEECRWDAATDARLCCNQPLAGVVIERDDCIWLATQSRGPSKLSNGSSVFIFLLWAKPWMWRCGCLRARALIFSTP